jgi:hypothetical protein
MASSTSGIERRLWTSGLGDGVGRGASLDWAERVAWLELSWARQSVEEYPSKRTRANEGVFRIISDSTCFTIEIPSHRAFSHRTKNRCVLANTAAGKTKQFLRLKN